MADEGDAPAAEAPRKSLAKAFYDTATGFRGVDLSKQTGRPAAEVRESLSNQEINQTKRRRLNSFVAPYPGYQIQVDLADFSRFKPPSVYRYALVAIDVFTKKIAAVPLRRKEASYTAEALDRVIAELGIPTTIATDQGSEFKQQFAAKLRYYEIKHIVLRTYAVFVERAIGTLKNRIIMRQRAFPKPWPVFLDEVVKQTNSIPHRTTGVAPDEAEDKEEEVLDALLKHASTTKGGEPRAIHRKTYEALSVGDTVRVALKVRPDATANVWSVPRKIEEISADDPKQYRVGDTWYLRHEILRLQDVQKPFAGRLRGQGVFSALGDREAR
jgi:transposase InsO family protein